MHTGRIAAALIVTVLGVAGCSATVLGRPVAARPQSDEELLHQLYDEFLAAAQRHDTAAFLALTCPGVRSEIDPELWFKDVDAKRAGDFTGTEAFTLPTSSTDYAPEATAWRRILIEPSGHIRVAKIEGTWYVCET